MKRGISLRLTVAGRVASRSWVKKTCLKRLQLCVWKEKEIYFSTLPVDETKLGQEEPELIERGNLVQSNHCQSH